MSLSIEAMKRIVELTEQGRTRPEIAREVGVNRATIYRHQKALNLL